MKPLSLGLAAALFLSTTASAVPAPPPSAPTLTARVAASGGTFDNNPYDYDLLLNAVIAAGLDDELASPSISVTLFAPNDRAFVRLARDLGYTGTGESGAFDHIVGALTQLGGGNPIPLLTQVLLYHVATERLGPLEVIFACEIETLQGGEIRPQFLRLRDNEPNLADPYLTLPLAVNASNGILHTINRVLIPIDIP